MQMMEQLDLRARWGPRRMGIEECVEHTLRFLKLLAGCDDVFGHGWLKCGGSLKEARSSPITFSRESIDKVLRGGVVRDSADSSIIEDFGFSFDMWNGSDDDSVNISIQCGAFPDADLIPLANRVWITFPDSGNAAKRIIKPDKLYEIVNAVCVAFDPDWARISTNRIDQDIYTTDYYKGQKAGWITYISDRYGRLPMLPKEYSIRRCANVGSLILIKSVRHALSTFSPAAAEEIRRLSELLGHAGFLAPLPPPE